MVVINVDYPGEKGKHLLKKCCNKLRRFAIHKVKVLG